MRELRGGLLFDASPFRKRHVVRGRRARGSCTRYNSFYDSRLHVRAVCAACVDWDTRVGRRFGSGQQAGILQCRSGIWAELDLWRTLGLHLLSLANGRFANSSHCTVNTSQPGKNNTKMWKRETQKGVKKTNYINGHWQNRVSESEIEQSRAGQHFCRSSQRRGLAGEHPTPFSQEFEKWRNLMKEFVFLCGSAEAAENY